MNRHQKNSAYRKSNSINSRVQRREHTLFDWQIISGCSSAAASKENENRETSQMTTSRKMQLTITGSHWPQRKMSRGPLQKQTQGSGEANQIKSLGEESRKRHGDKEGRMEEKRQTLETRCVCVRVSSYSLVLSGQWVPVSSGQWGGLWPWGNGTGVH